MRSETRIHAWSHSHHSQSVHTQLLLHRVVTFLVGALGVVLVMLMVWVVLLVVR